MASVLLKLAGVTKSFAGAEGGPPIAVLQAASLEVAAGESVAIIGPSGSGKSTLLNLIGALDRPDAGEVLFEGQNPAGFNEVELAKFRNQKIGFIFQAHHLLPHCTVWENVLVPALADNKSPSAETLQRAERLLKRVGLGERLQHRPGQLSGGERQRVAVVRALVNQPPLLLADEPTGALDRNSAAELGKLLVELNREEKVSLVTVTHSLELAGMMQRVFELAGGKLTRK